MCVQRRGKDARKDTVSMPETGAEGLCRRKAYTEAMICTEQLNLSIYSSHCLLMPGFTKDTHTNLSSQVILWISWYHDIQVSSHTRHKESLRTEWMASELNGDQDYSRKGQENLGLKGCQFLKPTGDHWQFRKNGYSHTPFSNISYFLVRHKSFVLPFRLIYLQFDIMIPNTHY